MLRVESTKCEHKNIQFGSIAVNLDRRSGAPPVTLEAQESAQCADNQRGYELPLINSRAVDLLDSDRPIGLFASLERRTSRGGRDFIDHRPGSHDARRSASTCECIVGLVLIGLQAGRIYQAPSMRGTLCPPFLSC